MKRPQTRQTDGRPQRSFFFAGRRRLIAILSIVVMIGLWLLLRPSMSVEDELAAIDATHAIRPGENAAEDYAALVLDATTPPPDPLLLSEEVRALTLAKPWRSADLPEAAQWVEDHRAIMDGLQQAARKPKCWFPVSDTERPTAKYFTMEYQGAMLLLRAANNDLGEGRVEAAMEKLLCVLQMAKHLRFQAHPSERSAGWAVGGEAVKRFGWVVVTQDIPDDWLTKLEATLPSVEDTWDEERRQWDRITSLYVRSRHGTRMRLLYILSRTIAPRRAATRHMYNTYLAESRAGRILLALRRHKNATGAWPAALSEIERDLPRDAFIDPVSRKRFVYRPTDDTFILYAVGPNAADEGGESGDDQLIWPQ